MSAVLYVLGREYRRYLLKFFPPALGMPIACDTLVWHVPLRCYRWTLSEQAVFKTALSTGRYRIPRWLVVA